MKFIELHLPIEAGKHNMHTDSEELSDSVSLDDGRPVDCNCCCVFFFFVESIFGQLCVFVCTGRMCGVCLFVCVAEKGDSHWFLKIGCLVKG